MIEFVTIAYNGDVDRLLESIPTTYNVQIFIHSKTDRYDHLVYRDNVILKPYYKNRGLSKSWNEGILDAWKRKAMGVVIVNDDCVFPTFGDVDIMASATIDNWITAANVGYSCIGVSRKAFDKVGCFDENIFPAYYEDCDYSRRLSLAGISIAQCEATVEHEGSGTIKKSPELNDQNLHTMMAIQRYYRAKWGGLNGEELYRIPFNDPRFTFYIHPTARHEPYPKYNRYDRDIVLV